MDEATIERIAVRVAAHAGAGCGLNVHQRQAVHDVVRAEIRRAVNTPPTPTGRTIDVRVPLIVGSDGTWAASGWSNQKLTEMDWGMICDMLSDQVAPNAPMPVEKRVILTATVELPPDASEVQAGVESAEEKEADDGSE